MGLNCGHFVFEFQDCVVAPLCFNIFEAHRKYVFLLDVLSFRHVHVSMPLMIQYPSFGSNTKYLFLHSIHLTKEAHMLKN